MAVELTDAGAEPSFRVRWSIVFQIVGYILGLFLMWNAMSNRMTALETSSAIRWEQAQRDITEMKADIKTLLARKP